MDNNKLEQLEEVRRQVISCKCCSIAYNEKRNVPGYGDPEAEVMAIGEAPGRNEVEQGIPFIGEAGKKLDQILEAAEVERKELYITNTIKCRPPNNRNPISSEKSSCEPYLIREIAIIKPKLIIALGRVSLEALVSKKSIPSTTIEIRKRQRARLFQSKINPAFPVMYIYHPSFVLRKYVNPLTPEFLEAVDDWRWAIHILLPRLSRPNILIPNKII